MARKTISLNLFDNFSLAHNAYGMWNHPDDQRRHYKKLEHWIQKARLTEQAGIDCLFFADNLGIADRYRGSARTSIEKGVHIPALDPSVLIPALAQETRHLAFALSASTTYESPYSLARRLSTLDHLTDGRLAWNVVTTSTASASKAFGLARPPEHDARYDRADEFLQVCYQLWEGAWEDDAVILSNGTYADPDKVHTVTHQGEFFAVTGLHQSEPSPQRTPVLFQAGSSARGRAFAAQHAECVFLGGTTPERVKQYVQDIRALAQAHGRQPASLKMFKGLSVIVGKTREDAETKLRDYERYWDAEAAYANFSGNTDIDLAALSPDETFTYRETIGHQSRLAQYTTDARNPTVREAMARISNIRSGSGSLNMVIGTPADIADYIERLVDEADIDGINFAQLLTPGTISDLAELVIPELRRRNLLKESLEPGTYREKIQGTRTLAPEHPGSGYRRQAATT